MTYNEMQRLLNDLGAGQHLDLDSLDPAIRNQFLDEFEARGFVLDSNQLIGETEICDACDGEGMSTNGRDECRKCEGYSMTITFGKETRPFRG